MQVRERTSALRCAYCHGDLEPRAIECPRCRTWLHEECVVGECPTLGCGSLPLRVRLRGQVARGSLFFGVVFPLLALLANVIVAGLLVPESKVDHHARWRVAFDPTVHACLAPVLIWSLAAYGAYSSGVRQAWVRVGLWGGVPVAGLFGFVYGDLYPEAIITFMIVVGLLFAAPYTTFVTYLLAAIGYERSPEPGGSLPRTAGFGLLWTLLASLGTYEGLERMHRLYESLPDHRKGGDCYLVTVASRGDPRITGAELVRTRDGRERLVSRQLRRFKAFELVLAALAPRGHRALRAVYDRVGPRLAARVTPRGATFLHLAFKPAELGVALVLRALLGDPEELLSATYR